VRKPNKKRETTTHALAKDIIWIRSKIFYNNSVRSKVFRLCNKEERASDINPGERLIPT
jgi:hypothetical protein